MLQELPTTCSHLVDQWISLLPVKSAHSQLLRTYAAQTYDCFQSSVTYVCACLMPFQFLSCPTWLLSSNPCRRTDVSYRLVFCVFDFCIDCGRLS